MLWQRSTKSPSEAMSFTDLAAGVADEERGVWVAVEAAGVPFRTAEGHLLTRYDRLPGAAIYKAKRVPLDKAAAPEELPDGFDALSREGNIVRFCFTGMAQNNWVYMDTWKRRRWRQMQCGVCSCEVPGTLPLRCPTCGELRGDVGLYAHAAAQADKGAWVKVCVYEAWLSGARAAYLRGERPQPQPDPPPSRFPAPQSRRPTPGTSGDPAESISDAATADGTEGKPHDPGRAWRISFLMVVLALCMFFAFLATLGPLAAR